jgi:hypothetical protein
VYSHVNDRRTCVSAMMIQAANNDTPRNNVVEFCCGFMLSVDFHKSKF